MKSQAKWILLIICFSIFSFYAGKRWERFWSSPVDFATPIYKIQKVKFNGDIEPVFLKSKAWGLLGNHTVTVVSNSSDLEFYPDSTYDYIFPGTEELLYEKVSDTLVIYHPYKSHIPDSFNSKIDVKIVQIDIYKWRDMKEKAEDGIQFYH